MKYVTLCLYVALPTDLSCACQAGRHQGVALNREIVASHSLLHSTFMALYYIFLFCQLKSGLKFDLASHESDVLEN